jgi:transposase
LTPEIGGMLRKRQTKESKEMKERRIYDRSFKEEAVKLSKETSVSKAARSLGLHENTLRNWINSVNERADNPFIGSGRKYVSAQDAEKAALQKENRELKRANEILKEALGFFAASQKK